MLYAPVVTSKTYCVEVPDVLRLDDTNIFEDLMRLGAYKIDWSGHYGNNIFFSLTVEDEDVLNDIIKAIVDVFNKL